MFKPIPSYFAFIIFWLSPFSLAEGSDAEGISLKDTNVMVRAPKGWKHDTAVFTSRPSVYFHIQLSPKGIYYGDISLSLSLDQKNYMAKNRSPGWRYFKIGQREAAVLVSRGHKIVDFSDGTGMNVEQIYETVTLQDGNNLYRCELITTPKKYPIYKGSAVRLCRTLYFKPN
jgi:hypothetical protein